VLNSAGLREIRQIAHISPDLLSMFIGGGAAQLRLFANGIDDRPVIVDREDAKSYSEQQTFSTDVTDEDFIVATVRGMADRLMAKVRDD
jgi:DNA polymerase-4